MFNTERNWDERTDLPIILGMGLVKIEAMAINNCCGNGNLRSAQVNVIKALDMWKQ